jgi:tetratricopeptide (TPR) repeat protein
MRWRLLLTAICATVLPVLLLEATLRLVGYGYPPGFFVPIPGAWSTNQFFGRRFFPVLLARTPVVERLTPAKPPGTYRIFVLGESAAMGFPEPGFSFGRQLEAMLRRMYPQRRFEVISAAMTAINSHVLVPIARDCAALQPDLFVVYAGNNEVVGPFGSGTVFTRSMGSLRLIRTAVWLSGTRTGQWLSSLAPRRDQPSEWRGMEMFLGHAVPADDPRLPNVYANFRRNLEDICRIGKQAGADVIVSTVAVNLKDSPPFGPGGPAWEHYRRGEFALARDLDTLRFRADSHINRIIREVGGRLVDTERIFGVRGNDLFYEHVHLNFDGNYLLASALLPQVIRSLRLEPLSAPDEQTVARDLARTAWDDYRAQADIAAMMQRPPFSQHPSLPAAPGAEVRQAAESRYREILRERPDDLPIRQRLADVLATRGELAAAEAEWLALLSRVPDVEAWRIALGSVLADQKKLDEAMEEYLQVLRADRQSAAAQFGAGSVRQRQRKWDDASRYYAAALRLNPGYAEVENNLGLMRMESAGDVARAIEHYRRALEWKPELADAGLNLAGALARTGRIEEAVSAYERVLRAHPDSYEAHYRLGGLLAGSGNMPAASEHLQAAVRLRPESAEARYDLGSVLSREGVLGEAVGQYTEALRLRPDYAEAWNNLGSALARSGNMSRAIACFKKAIELRPDFAAARNNLAAAAGRN